MIPRRAAFRRAAAHLQTSVFEVAVDVDEPREAILAETTHERTSGTMAGSEAGGVFM